jgi:hypothetical protein
MTGALAELAVSQYPVSGAEPLATSRRWVALPAENDARVPSGRLSILAHTAGAPITDRACGLLVDDWTEVVPSVRETTSLSFHYDGPSSAAPNVILLCAPPPNHDNWHTPEIIRHVHEAMAMARLRAVGPHSFGSTGLPLGGLYATTDPDNAGAGIDFGALTAEPAS